MSCKGQGSPCVERRVKFAGNQTMGSGVPEIVIYRDRDRDLPIDVDIDIDILNIDIYIYIYI